MAMATSCASGNMAVSGVKYQSVRTSFAQPEDFPKDAKIVTQYFFSPTGKLMVVVYNRTNEIMTIDQTRSFLINTDGMSKSYYDPTVVSTTSGTMESSTSGTTVNLGAISSALGIGGIAGTLLGGISVGNASTEGNYNSSTVTVQDMPSVSVGPHGKMVLSKEFEIMGLGGGSPSGYECVDAKYKDAPLKFSVCVSYSLEGSDESMKLVTDFYVNTNLYADVSKGMVSDAFTQIYRSKPDAVAEYVYLFNINNNLPTTSHFDYFGGEIKIDKNYSYYIHGSLVDYQ